MKFKVYVEDLFFWINVGQGYNDFAWLALVGAKLYSNQKNPNANYLPCFLEYKYIETDMYVPPHPRTKIYNLFKEPDSPIIKIQIRKGVVPLSYEQEIWYDQAYGKLRNIMKLDFSLIMQASKIPVRQDPIYKVQIQYNMFNEIKYEFSAAQYPAIQEIELRNDDEQLGTFVNFRGSKELPLGSITYQFIAYVKPDKQDDDGQRQKVILDTRNIQASVLTTPSNPISTADIQKKIKDNYKSPEQQLKQLDLLENKVEKEPTQLCPYNFKKIWTIIEKNADGILKLDNLEPNLIERVGDFLDNNLNKLYEVFYQYTQLYDQDMEKKDEIAITFQDIMHFLKFYGLVQDSSSLFEFVQFYDTKELRTGDIEDTLKATVKFAEFIVIIIKLAQYRKTINLVDVESQEHLIRQIVEKILYVNEMEDQFNEFQKHMKYNHVLTNYIRENQAKFQGTFISRLRVSSDQSYKIKCHIKREEIKQQIQDAGYKGDNLDGIMDQCYDELFQEEQRFQGFEGLFYYEYLQVMQWLAIRLVQNNDDQEENQNEEMPLEKMIERLDYLIEQIDI